ncbi:MAG: AlpA family phage regulatory protein [Methylobacteriaceae bacterium]|nr:AlpA family phage regulatory protein [Methylobacteriaceae bacterium]
MSESKSKRFVALPEVERRVNRSRWWIRNEINAGRFPKPVPINGRRIEFVDQEIDRWMDEQIAKRDGTTAPAARVREDA